MLPPHRILTAASLAGGLVLLYASVAFGLLPGCGGGSPCALGMPAWAVSGLTLGLELLVVGAIAFVAGDPQPEAV